MTGGAGPRPEALRRADAALCEAAGRAAADPARPASHFRPPGGWMNDPNGALFRDGLHHLFYQHNPYDDRWGSVHWGHATSPDLVRWTHRPIALAPLAAEGEEHCFSGCAAGGTDETPVLLYTSVRDYRRAADGSESWLGEQWAVTCDDALTRFARWPGNPVVERGVDGTPSLAADWRDPFVHDEGGRRFLLLGASRPGDAGGDDGGAAPESVIAAWEAPDARDPLRWRWRGFLRRAPRERTGFFECPLLLRLGDRHLLAWSPLAPVEYALGRFDPEACAFEETASGRLDESPDYYAPTRFFADPAPAPALVGWARGWSPGRGWNGVLGFPRRLGLDAEGRLRQAPEPGLESLRGPRRSVGPIELDDSWRPLPGPVARALELRLRVAASDARVELRLVDDATGHPLLLVALGPGGRAEVGGISFDVPPLAGGTRELRLFWDRSLAETFLDGGLRACTRVVDDAPGGAVRAELRAVGEGARLLSAEAWELAPIWGDAEGGDTEGAG